jgi:hypothetical protein
MTIELAEASPSKKFFLDMFIRDISLEDCILDLIDNSIDSLIRSQQIDVSDAILNPPVADNNGSPTGGVGVPKVDVKLSKGKFQIIDNCGGIPWDYALKDAFRFGHRSLRPEGQLGVYGIGLKRAILKIGNDDIRIESKTIEKGFETVIDKDWLEDETNWKIPLTAIDGAGDLKKAGTTITIKGLRPETKMRFGSGSLEKKLKDAIAQTYSLFLERYVSIALNGHIIQPVQIRLGESEEVTPAVERFERDYDDGKVKVTLVTSLAARGPGGKWNADVAGWYALCNGRVVVAADKTDLTGWGAGGPQFHSKYMGFIGMVFFFSKNPHLLPWTTTKRGLNKESQIYQEAKNKMLGVARPVLNFLNRMYPSDPAAQPQERKIVEHIQQTDTRAAASKPGALFQVKPSEGTLEKRTVRVQYDAETSDIDRAKKCLKKRWWSARKIGEYTFKHFLRTECPK